MLRRPCDGTGFQREIVDLSAAADRAPEQLFLLGCRVEAEPVRPLACMPSDHVSHYIISICERRTVCFLPALKDRVSANQKKDDIRIRFEGKTVEVEFNDTAPKPLQGFTVTAPVQILEHNTGCWWERTITARIRDGSTIPVVLDHVYWNWITGTPMHIHLDGIQRIRVIEDKHHQREENN